MITKQVAALFVWNCLVLFAAHAQTPPVIPLSSEPHHHLVLHNQYVNLYQVEVAPHDTVILHRHEYDAISVMLSDSEVTVRAPGKPDVHQTLSSGQIRLQKSGYVHSTTIGGDTTYRNVTVELLLPQQGARNLCAPVIANQPLNCLSDQELPLSATHSELPQFETDRTRVSLLRVLPHQSVTLGEPDRPQLLVLLDALSAMTQEKDHTASQLQPGEFLWLAANKAGHVFKNESDREVRLISFVLKSP
jgi:quercetin dioxygenase-like cupin family protein